MGDTGRRQKTEYRRPGFAPDFAQGCAVAGQGYAGAGRRQNTEDRRVSGYQVIRVEGIRRTGLRIDY